MNIIAPDVMRKSDAAFWRLKQHKDTEWAEKWQAWHKDIQARPDFQQWYDQFLRARDERFTAYVAALSAVTVPTKRAAIRKFLAMMAKNEGSANETQS